MSTNRGDSSKRLVEIEEETKIQARISKIIESQKFEQSFDEDGIQSRVDKFIAALQARGLATGGNKRVIKT